MATEELGRAVRELDLHSASIGWSYGSERTVAHPRGEIMRPADICYEYGHEMEFGPSRHGGSELYFSYVLEPGGNRVELGSGGYLFFEPDRPIFEPWVSEGGVGDMGQRVSSRHVRARDPAGGSQDGEGGGGVHRGGVT